jgi:hypothetical protein
MDSCYGKLPLASERSGRITAACEARALRLPLRCCILNLHCCSFNVGRKLVSWCKQHITHVSEHCLGRYVLKKRNCLNSEVMIILTDIYYCIRTVDLEKNTHESQRKHLSCQFLMTMDEFRLPNLCGIDRFSVRMREYQIRSFPTFSNAGTHIPTIIQNKRRGWVVSSPTSYLEGPRFKSRQADPLFSLSSLLFSLVPRRKLWDSNLN